MGYRPKRDLNGCGHPRDLIHARARSGQGQVRIMTFPQSSDPAGSGSRFLRAPVSARRHRRKRVRPRRSAPKSTNSAAPANMPKRCRWRRGSCKRSRRNTAPRTATSPPRLNNLAEIYGHQGNDAEAEPLLKRAIAILDKAVGLDFAGSRARVEQSRGAVPAAGTLCRGRAVVQTCAGDPREIARARSSRFGAVAQ